MKQLLRKLFSPLLNQFEQGSEPYDYKPMNRKVLIIIGFFFGGLATAGFVLIPDGGDKGYFIPVVIFALVALVCLIVGLLGNDRAVSKLWFNR